MELSFKLPISVTDNKKIYCKEFTNKHFIDLQKFIEFDSDTDTACFFDKICYGLIDCDGNKIHVIDKFLTLLKVRCEYIDPVLSYSSSDGASQALDINMLIENIIEGYEKKFETFQVENIFYTIGPSTRITKFDNVLNHINSIKIDNEEIDLGHIDINQKEEILNNIPCSHIPVIKDKVKNIKQKPIILFQTFEKDKMKDNMFYFTNFEMFSFLKLCFSEGYENLFYYVYIFTTKLSTSYTDFLKYTPKETRKILKHYKKEMEEKNKQKEQNTPPGINP